MKQNYKVILTTLSPVFIGSGNSIDKSEYLYDKINKQVVIFKRKDLLTGLEQMDLLDKYCDAVLTSKFSLEKFFYDNNVKRYNKWISHRIDSSAVVDGEHSLKNILCFIKDAYGVPYIPGSSLKGAIRTAMLNSKIAKMNLDDEKKQLLQTLNYTSKGDLRRKVNSIEVKAFNTLDRKSGEDNKSNAVNDIFSKMLISDSEPVENCKLILCDKVDVTLRGEEKTVSSVVRECLPPNTKITFTLSIDTEYFSIENIRACIAERFESYRKNYLDFFDKADVDKYTAANNIVLGGGAGFQSKTVTYELLGKDKGLEFTRNFMCANFRNGKHENDKIISPHTRKTTEYDGKLFDMGVCRIDFEKTD